LLRSYRLNRIFSCMQPDFDHYQFDNYHHHAVTNRHVEDDRKGNIPFERRTQKLWGRINAAHSDIDLQSTHARFAKFTYSPIVFLFRHASLCDFNSRSLVFRKLMSIVFLQRIQGIRRSRKRFYEEGTSHCKSFPDFFTSFSFSLFFCI
jgi:hypothetical protein